MIVFSIGERHYSVLGDTGRLSVGDVILLQTRGHKKPERRCLACTKASAPKTKGRCLTCVQTQELEDFEYDKDCGIPLYR